MPLGNRQPPFGITIQELDPSAVTVHVHGELDISAAPALRDALREQLERDQHVVLDLERVGFLDSTGLSAIVEAWRAYTTHRRRLRLRPRFSPQVHRLLVLTGLIDVLELMPHRAADSARGG